MNSKRTPLTYWQIVWKQFKQNYLAVAALFVISLFCLAAIYAPFLASSKPLVVQFEGKWYFPLFRYLFFKGFFTKPLDLFYNLLIFTFPLFVLAWIAFRKSPQQRSFILLCLFFIHLLIFLYLLYRSPQDPAANAKLNAERQEAIQRQFLAEKQNPVLTPPPLPNWEKDLAYLTPYAKLNLILRYQQRKAQQERLKPYESIYADEAKQKGRDPFLPTLWQQDLRHEKAEEDAQQAVLTQYQSSYPEAKSRVILFHQYCHQFSIPTSMPAWAVCDFLAKLPKNDLDSFIEAKKIVDRYEVAQAKIKYLKDRRSWLEEQASQLRYEVMPLLRPFHWQDDAGGEQALNRHISWWELTRINRKDMVASLIFGIRVSLSVGLLAISLALLIGIPIGAMAGYYGGKVDILTYRLIEIWESMPTFFMLLMIVAFLQTKSIFIVIAIIGLFGWTSFSRFIRGEFFRQKQLPYVEACHALGFKDRYIMFSHLLPNAIPPLLTLVPFAIMGAITSEAGLSFLGLGEEGSSSWGVLMDEGRSAFPSESYLLWPPAILLTLLLVSIALVGDALRDALDPKLHA